MDAKVIVIGGVHGQFSSVFKKLASLQSKPPFSVAIIVGDFFADPAANSEQDDDELAALLEGKVIVPLPTYFTLNTHPMPAQVIERISSSQGELCENLYFIGKRTTLTTSERIKIVALGGNLDPNVTVGTSKDNFTPFHTLSDIKVLHGANNADILITSSWPTSIRQGSKATFPEDGIEPEGHPSIADLCSILKPRYHFSTSTGSFFEREPFYHTPTQEQPDARPITRFISLASYGNASKQKWLYAFSIDPAAPQPSVVPPGTTASPLSSPSRKRPLDSQSRAFSRFAGDDQHHPSRPHKRARRPPPGPDECFFCLSNENLATHLITSIADDSYLTIAKGPLTTASTFPLLEFPSHMLIIPLSHSPTLSAIPEPDTRASTSREMTRYRHVLQKMLLNKAHGELGAVTWEVSRAAGIHAHWQFLPVSADLLRRGLVSAAFKVEAENEKYPKFEAREAISGADEASNFFRVWLWTPPAETDSATAANGVSSDGETIGVAGQEDCLVLPFPDDIRFDLQFGRRVLAKLLALEQRVSWQDCAQSQESEVADAEAFKAAFKDFDFAAA
ncbi:MAG: hypothetical protein M1833_003467 [Piccolia ochrophora]|nr:MAG: hypothetical protein M1833_003467 [Piccolia ochrophora]